MTELNLEPTFQPTTYTMSNASIKKIKKRYLTMLLTIPAVMLIILFIIVLPRGRLGAPNLFMFLIGGALIFVELEILVISSIMVRKIKENTITIGKDFIQRKSKVLEPAIEFKFIQKIKITRNPNHTINYIDIATSSQNIRLCGFNNMADIAEILKNHTPQVEIKEYTYKFNYDSPVMFIAIFVLCSAVFYFSGHYLSLRLSDIITAGLGIWFLFAKPISRVQGDRFRKLVSIISYVSYPITAIQHSLSICIFLISLLYAFT